MKIDKKDFASLIFLMLIFWAGVLREVNLPGIYMDAVNPDYLAAQTLYPGIQNPSWKIPTAIFPILGNLYHGVQNYYIDLAIFNVLGISVTSIRIAQAVFGATIVALLYFLGVLITRNRFVSFTTAALLATEIAFLASFRTQFYIILGAETWLFASLVAMHNGRRAGDFLSGVFYGLSIYSYFVMGFFGPALLVLLFNRNHKRPRYWFVGLLIGLLPYLVGYVSAIVALGGVDQFAAWAHVAINGLAPLSSNLSFIGRIFYVAQMAYLAISNGGNDLMIFGSYLVGNWPTIKSAFFIIVFVILAFKIHRKGPYLYTLLPLSYLAIAAIFGNRLWVHHFSVLVPISYLLLLIVLADLAKNKIRTVLISLFSITYAILNIVQCNDFFLELNRTGGTGKYSHALTRLAENALSVPKVLYVFPEWGFFMPFDLLTENKVHYILDLNGINNIKDNFDYIDITSWTLSGAQKYVAALKADGLTSVSVETYRGRNYRTAFYLVNGVVQRKKLTAHIIKEQFAKPSRAAAVEVK